MVSKIRRNLRGPGWYRRGVNTDGAQGKRGPERHKNLTYREWVELRFGKRPNKPASDDASIIEGKIDNG
jgi:hypothetical protein